MGEGIVQLREIATKAGGDSSGKGRDLRIAVEGGAFSRCGPPIPR